MLGLRGLISAAKPPARLGGVRTILTADSIAKLTSGGSKSLNHTSFRRPGERSAAVLKASDVSSSQAKQYAKMIPITGPISGRMTRVTGGNIDGAFRSLRYIVSSNSIRTDKNAQRFYKKPGKVAEEKTMRRKRKMFDAGIRRLIDIVKDAKRRGY